MSDQITNHFVQQYTTNVQLLLQQKDSRFAGAVMQKAGLTGKQAAVVDQFGAVTAQLRSTRYPDITPQTTPTDRRWVYPADYFWADWIDNADKLRMLIDPQSSYVQVAAATMNRTKDDVIVAAFFGTAKTGETGGTSTTFPAAQQISQTFGAGAATGLTVAKLKEARRILKANQVDPDEQMYCAITAKQDSDLLNEIQVINLDYNDRPVLVDGRVRSFLGFNFIDSERLVTDGTYRRIPVWAKSGMCLAMWEDVRTDISQIKTRAGQPWQVYVEMTLGATRVEEGKVVEIKCAE